MRVLQGYIINIRTNVIIKKYSSTGDLHSIVIEDKRIFYVRQSPLYIISKSVEYYGGTYEGAKEAAQNILGVSIPPIKISGKLAIYWFPSRSPNHDDCVWFSLEHVEGFLPLNDKSLKVIFRKGFEITIKSNERYFKKMIGIAANFKTIMEGRTDGASTFDLWDRTYIIVRDPFGNRYEVNRRWEDWEDEENN